MKNTLFSIVFLWGVVACSTETETVVPPSVVPPYFASDIPSPERNPLTAEGIELGRRLFYDPALSANGVISCASCHQQTIAFTDGEALSAKGVSGKPLLRHAPTLTNLAWHENGLFWEGGATDLESLTFAPLTHPDEMAMDLEQLVEILKTRYDYPQRFQRAFGIDTIHVAFVARALAQFQRTLISDDSRYDRYRRNEATLAEPELRGMTVFQQKCASCHSSDFFTDHAFHNNGLNASFPDGFEGIFQGRFRITLDPTDMGKYKTPTLRNVMLTAPYMHDGRFATIEEVLQHYTNGMYDSPTLAPVFRQEDGQLGLSLTQQEQQDLIAFLHTLTDSTFIQNPQFSNPF